MSDGCPISTIPGILTNQLAIASYMLLQRECFPLERMFPQVRKGKEGSIYTDLGGDSCLTNNDICFPAPLIDSKTTKDKCPLLVLRLTVLLIITRGIRDKSVFARHQAQGGKLTLELLGCVVGSD
jgi:hypothetical protein